MSMNYGLGTFPYIIQAGDTFWGLADENSTTVEAIMAINPGVDPNNLLVGEVIFVPGDPPSSRGPEFERMRREFERRRRDEFERRRREEEERRFRDDRRREEEERRFRDEFEHRRREDEFERRRREEERRHGMRPPF